MSAALRPLVRQRSLNAWAGAIEQQSRVWLPLQLRGQGVGWQSVLWGACLVGATLWVQIFFSLDLDGVAALGSAVLIACCVGGATWYFQRAQRREAHCGSVADFQHRTLTPVGLSEQQTIELGPDHSLGCYLNGGDHDSSVAFQLELRHARRGPLAALTVVQLKGGSTEDIETLDRCVNRLVDRLGIRRSGAPLLARSTTTERGSVAGF